MLLLFYYKSANLSTDFLFPVEKQKNRLNPLTVKINGLSLLFVDICLFDGTDKKRKITCIFPYRIAGFVYSQPFFPSDNALHVIPLTSRFVNRDSLSQKILFRNTFSSQTTLPNAENLFTGISTGLADDFPI